jgi:opacity protein-like surface antigen
MVVAQSRAACRGPEFVAALLRSGCFCRVRRRLHRHNGAASRLTVHVSFAVSVLTAGAAGASAADLPLKAKPIVAAGLDWSGVYIGVHAGYGGGMKDWGLDLPAAFVARGPLVGGQVGIKKQLGSLVFGLELDGSRADIKGTGVSTLGGPA